MRKRCADSRLWLANIRQPMRARINSTISSQKRGPLNPRSPGCILTTGRLTLAHSNTRGSMSGSDRWSRPTRTARRFESSRADEPFALLTPSNARLWLGRPNDRSGDRRLALDEREL